MAKIVTGKVPFRKALMFIVFLLSGFVITWFSITASNQRGAGSLIEMIENRASDITVLSRQVDSLGESISQSKGDNSLFGEKKSELDMLARHNAGADINGSGLKVVLDDAMPENYSNTTNNLGGNNFTSNDYVIHQQDIEGMINALYAGGAEIIAVQGNAITANSTIECVGNVLMIMGETYVPPFTIEAIGNRYLLENALNSSPYVQLYKKYVDRLGLGYLVTFEKNIHIKKVPSMYALQFARVTEMKERDDK
ncbi:MAG: DUF881 domain-containing protein [Bifidobacteriaceae bacterium]|nr:DUF881 domain-containing protein [Bifidobacteriaceae bacterium]